MTACGEWHQLVVVRQRRSRWLRWQHRLILYIDGQQVLAWNDVTLSG